jgi:hypothetical protein
MSYLAITETGRGSLESMFSEQAKLPPELTYFLSTLSNNLDFAWNFMEKLPAQFSSEMGRLLQLILAEITNVVDSTQEKVASGLLLERFGVPKAETEIFELAVPVYNYLAKNLFNSEKVAMIYGEKLQSAIVDLQRFVFIISSLMYDDQIEKIEGDIKKAETAPTLFDSEVVNDDRVGVEIVVETTKSKFSARVNELRSKLNLLKNQRQAWMNIIKEMFYYSERSQQSVRGKFEVNPANAL